MDDTRPFMLIDYSLNQAHALINKLRVSHGKYALSKVCVKNDYSFCHDKNTLGVATRSIEIETHESICMTSS